MDFWDSSALVPCLIQEEASAWARRTLQIQPRFACSAIGRIEVLSALHRSFREGRLTLLELQQSMAKLDRLLGFALLVKPTPRVLDLAARLIKVHPLRTLDAMQLAAALAWKPHAETSARFATCDELLASVARQEGLEILQP